MGWQVLDSVGYELNPVRNELLHLWRVFLACYFLGGNSTVSEIALFLYDGLKITLLLPAGTDLVQL